MHNRNERIVTLNQKANSNYYPAIEPLYIAKDDAEITVGGVENDGLDLLNSLIKHGLLSISKEDYDRVVKICNKSVNELTPSDIKLFSNIINDAKFVPNDPSSLLCLRILGGKPYVESNNFFTLKIFEKLSKHKTNFHIIFSDYSYDLIANYKNNKNNRASTLNLNRMVDNKLVSEKEINELIEKHYLPHLKLIDYSYQNNELTIYSNFLANKKIILDLVNELNAIEFTPTSNTKIIYKDGSYEEFIDSLNKIQKKFMALVKANKIDHLIFKYESNKYSTFYHFFYNHNLSELDCGKNIDHEYDMPVNYINGIYLRESIRDIYNHYETFDSKYWNFYRAYYSNSNSNTNSNQNITDASKELKTKISKLIQEFKGTGLLFPELTNNYDYNVQMFNLLKLIKGKNELWNKDNIKKIRAMKIDNLILFYQCLIEMEQFGELNQDTFNEISAMSVKELRLIRQYSYLRNLILLVNPSLAKYEIPALSNKKFYNNLHIILMYSKDVLNKEAYRSIIANLDNLEFLIELVKTVKSPESFIETIKIFNLFNSLKYCLPDFDPEKGDDFVSFINTYYEDIEFCNNFNSIKNLIMDSENGYGFTSFNIYFEIYENLYEDGLINDQFFHESLKKLEKFNYYELYKNNAIDLMLLKEFLTYSIQNNAKIDNDVLPKILGNPASLKSILKIYKHIRNEPDFSSDQFKAIFSRNNIKSENKIKLMYKKHKINRMFKNIKSNNAESTALISKSKKISNIARNLFKQGLFNGNTSENTMTTSTTLESRTETDSRENVTKSRSDESSSTAKNKSTHSR